MGNASDRTVRLASFFRVLHPLEMVAVLVSLAMGVIAIPTIPVIVGATAIGAVGALLRRAWVVAAMWAALSAWLGAGGPGLLFLVRLVFGYP